MPRLPECLTGDKYRTAFDFIMSQDFRDLAWGCPPDADAKERAVHHFAETGDPLPALHWYVRYAREIPTWLGKGILESKKPKRRGRNSRPEQRNKKFKSDLICFAAVNSLMRDCKMKQTPAEQKTGEHMHLTRQAVHLAYQRIERRYFPKK